MSVKLPWNVVILLGSGFAIAKACTVSQQLCAADAPRTVCQNQKGDRKNEHTGIPCAYFRKVLMHALFRSFRTVLAASVEFSPSRRAFRGHLASIKRG